MSCCYTPSGRIGGRKASPVSQGKKIQVSCDTSVMKVSTMRPAHRLGVDGREMRLGQEVAHHLGGLAGVDEVIDDQHALAVAAADANNVGGDALDQP